MAESRTLRFIIDAQDKASSALKAVQDKLDGMQSKLATASDASSKFALGLAGVGVAVGGFGMKAIQAASDAEQAQISFTTMLGSAEKAQTFIAQMKQFAAKTPFETTDITKAAQTFLSFGMDVNTVMPTVQMIGDVAMGNKEKFASLSLAFAQVQSTGKLMGQDLLQMVNQGFNPLQIISEKTGESMSSLKDKMADGAISAEDVANAFKIATSEGGRFYGGMEAQSQSLAGVWSTLSDTFNQFMIEQGAKLIPMAKEFVGALSDLITNWLPKLIDGLGNTINWFKENEWAIYLISGAILGALVPSIVSMALAFASAAVALAPWMIAGALIAGIVAGIMWIVNNWDMLKAKAFEIFNAIASFFTGIWATITGAATSAWTTVTNFLTGIWNGIVNTAQMVWGGIVSFFTAIWNGIVAVFQFMAAFAVGLVIAIFNAFGIDIVAVFGQVKDFIVATWDGIKNAFQVAGDFIASVWNAVWETISTVWDWISEKFNIAMAGIRQIWENIWNAVFNFIGPIWEKIKTAVGAGWTWITSKFTTATQPLTNAWNNMWQGLGNVVVLAWEGVKNVIKNSINWIIDKVNTVIDLINSVTAAGASAIGMKAPQIGKIPMLANGGIVTRPTMAIIGEAGPEAVVPLSRGGLGAGMGTTLVFNISNNEFVGEEGIADRIFGQLMRQIKDVVALG